MSRSRSRLVSVLLTFTTVAGAGCTGLIDGTFETDTASDAGPGAPPIGDNGDNADAAPPPPAPDAAPPGDVVPSFDMVTVSRESTMSIAHASVGYTYWWGHGGLGGDKAGKCTGNCPNCTHAGTQGADCSGLVGKAWMLPEAMPITGSDRHPFSTYNFRYGTNHWAPLARDDMQPGDAMVHNANGSGHIFIYEKDDPWGDFWSIEARGCAYGVVHNIRSADSSYIAIRRSGF